VVLESGFWSRADRDDKRLGARRIGVPVELHALTPSLDQRWERIERRQRDPTGVLITRDQLEEWEQFWAPGGGRRIAAGGLPTRRRRDYVPACRSALAWIASRTYCARPAFTSS
jgi:predicted kinase